MHSVPEGGGVEHRGFGENLMNLKVKFKSTTFKY